MTVQPADDTDVAPTDELLPWPTQAFQLVKPLGQDVVMAFPVPLETTLPPRETVITTSPSRPLNGTLP